MDGPGSLLGGGGGAAAVRTTTHGFQPSMVTCRGHLLGGSWDQLRRAGEMLSYTFGYDLRVSVDSESLRDQALGQSPIPNGLLELLPK